MALIEYNILDEDLIALFDAFGLHYDVIGGQCVVLHSTYDACLDQIYNQLELLDNYNDPLWTNWDEIDENVLIWSTDRKIWV